MSSPRERWRRRSRADPCPVERRVSGLAAKHVCLDDQAGRVLGQRDRDARRHRKRSTTGQPRVQRDRAGRLLIAGNRAGGVRGRRRVQLCVMEHDGAGGTLPVDAADAAISNGRRVEPEANVRFLADRDVRPKFQRHGVTARVSAARARHRRDQEGCSTMKEAHRASITIALAGRQLCLRLATLSYLRRRETSTPRPSVREGPAATELAVPAGMGDAVDGENDATPTD